MTSGFFAHLCFLAYQPILILLTGMSFVSGCLILRVKVSVQIRDVLVCGWEWEVKANRAPAENLPTMTNAFLT